MSIMPFSFFYFLFIFLFSFSFLFYFLFPSYFFPTHLILIFSSPNFHLSLIPIHHRSRLLALAHHPRPPSISLTGGPSSSTRPPVPPPSATTPTAHPGPPPPQQPLHAQDRAPPTAELPRLDWADGSTPGGGAPDLAARRPPLALLLPAHEPEELPSRRSPASSSAARAWGRQCMGTTARHGSRTLCPFFPRRATAVPRWAPPGAGLGKGEAHRVSQLLSDRTALESTFSGRG
jgi:hypothetical protein